MEITGAKNTAYAVAALKHVCKEIPMAAVVLGSGVDVLSNLSQCTNLSYEEVFGIVPSVMGHGGSISLGYFKDRLIAVFKGRFHLYEGYNLATATLPARTVAAWGVPALYLTNAAGGVNSNFSVGDLMLIVGFRDHLDPVYKETGLLPALSSNNTNCENRLTAQLIKTGAQLVSGRAGSGSFRPLQQGVYAGLLGPSYETPAEVDMLRRLQVDAVGMSTVPELKAVQGSSTQAAAISVITNVWNENTVIGGHEEVLAAAQEASQRLEQLLLAAFSSNSLLNI